MRDIAWGVVFCSHSRVLPLAMGQVAMSVFFALSGFLITALLVEERSMTGRVSLKRFFARRALRLLPALGFFLAGWLALVLATRDTRRAAGLGAQAPLYLDPCAKPLPATSRPRSATVATHSRG